MDDGKSYKSASAYVSLKPWQQAFVDHYVVHAHAPNPTASMRAVRPDYRRPDVHASKVMALPEVQAAINERLTRRRKSSELDEIWVLERLQAVAEHCMQTAAFDPTGASRALELIGKHFAMFTERREIDIGDRLAKLADADLDARLGELLQPVELPCH